VTLASTLLVAACAASVGLYLTAWALVAGWAWWHRTAAASPRHGSAGVTILKPLCGVDEDLERNLASFFALDHQPLQLVFGAADPGDPALALVQRLARRHPGHDVAIVVGCDETALSPKIGVLERLLPHARHEVLLLSDSNVRVAPGDVARVLPALDDPLVGMVHQPVVGVGERSLAAAVENLHYTELAGFLSIAAAVFAGQQVVNGKGQWVRRAALDQVGGFEGVRDVAADDYVLGQLVAAAGWRVRLAPIPVTIVHRDWSWRAAGWRHLRHSGMRWRLCPWAYPLELLLAPTLWALALLMTPWAGWAMPLVVGKIALEAAMARILRRAWPSWRHALLIPVKDLFYAVGWFASFTTRTVHWRGRAYALTRGTRLVPLPEPMPSLSADRRAAA